VLDAMGDAPPQDVMPAVAHAMADTMDGRNGSRRNAIHRPPCTAPLQVEEVSQNVQSFTEREQRQSRAPSDTNVGEYVPAE
jgi:hypothetical protein